MAQRLDNNERGGLESTPDDDMKSKGNCFTVVNDTNQKRQVPATLDYANFDQRWTSNRFTIMFGGL